MKVGRKLLSILLSITLIVSAFSFALVPASAYEQADLDTQRRGGVTVYFFNSEPNDQHAVSTLNFLDPSNMAHSHMRIASHSSHTVHLVEWGEGYEHTTFDKESQNTLAPGNGSYFTVNFKDASVLQSLPHGYVMDLSVKYTMEDVYDENGDLVVFETPAYIGVWDTSTDSKQPNVHDNYHNDPGFVVKQGGDGGLEVSTALETTEGILEEVSLSGHYTNNVNFEYNYWIDSTHLSSKTWEATGFRLFARKFSGVRYHLQSSQRSYGTYSLGGSFANTPSLAMGNFEVTWPQNPPFPDGYAGGDYTATSSTNYVAHRRWEPVQETKWGSLHGDGGTYAYMPFGGTLFQTNSNLPATITFTNMLWTATDGVWWHDDGHFSGKINVYVYDKTVLENALNQNPSDMELQYFAPVSARFTNSAWTNYVNALRNARNVLANYKTNQKAVNDAAQEYINAVNALQPKSAIGTQVAKVTDSMHNGDKQKPAVDSNRYFLLPLATPMTVPFLTQSESVTFNRHSNALTVGPYTEDDTSINNGGTLDYWTIDESAAGTVLTAAQDIIDKHESGEYCYTEEYYQAVKSAKTALDALMIDGSAVPETQAQFDEAVNALKALVDAEATDSNHRHSDPAVREEVITTEATCQHGGRKEIRCKYCDTVIEEQEIPTQPHNYEGAEWITDEEANCKTPGSKHQECQYPDCTERNVETIPIDSTKHVGTTHMENGYNDCVKGYYAGDIICDDCHQKIGEGEKREGTGAHQWNEEDVVYKDGKAPTCTDGATRIVTCSVCGATEEREVEPLGHSYGDTPDETIQGTCTTPGKAIYRCKNGCGENDIKPTGLDPDNHVGQEYVLEGTHRDATCKEAGYEGDIYCDACQHKIRDGATIDKLSHSFTDNWKTTVEPGCETTGLKSLQCDNCDEFDPKNTDVTISATGHNYPEEPDETIEGNCVTAGQKIWHCDNNCGKDKTEPTGTNPENHAGPEYVKEGSGQPATCTADGHEDDTYCQACGQKVKDGAPITALGHSFTEKWVNSVDPQCESAGKKTLYCDRCNEPDPQNTDVEVPALGHDYDYKNGKVIVKATYEHPGTIEYTCTRCTATEQKQYTVEEHEHEGGKATCRTQAICIICEAPYGGFDENNHEDLQPIPEKEKTCTEDGSHGGMRCEACGKTTVEPTIIPASHEWDAGTVTTTATCTQPEVKTLNCTVCKETKTEEGAVDPSNHTHTEYRRYKEPTCTEAGSDKNYCNDCKNWLEDEKPVAATGHVWGDWRTLVESTCTMQGSQVRTCTKCSEGRETKNLPLKEHTPGEWVPKTAASCLTGGTDVQRCKDCGTELQTRDSSPLGHSPVEIPGKEPTCFEDGQTGGETCSRCGAQITPPTIIPKGTGTHRYGDGVVQVEPTSKREGFIRYTCEICGSYYDEIIPALDHDHTGGKATCVKRAVCETCGEPYGEYDNSVHEHIVPMKDVEPTCTEDGHKGGTQCADCGKVIDAPTVLPATGHTDENGDGICDVDGKSIYDTDEPDGGYTWDSFRCKYCFKYASLADQPVVGPFYRFVHFFVHLGQYIAYLFRK